MHVCTLGRKREEKKRNWKCEDWKLSLVSQQDDDSGLEHPLNRDKTR